jgi:hypothetical protein
MSNHGKESTNKEGVNIDETQTKIDMGKLITALGQRSILRSRFDSESIKNLLQIFLLMQKDLLARLVSQDLHPKELVHCALITAFPLLREF